MKIQIKCSYRRCGKKSLLARALYLKSIICDIGICITIVSCGITHIQVKLDSSVSRRQHVVSEQWQVKHSSEDVESNLTIMPALAASSDVLIRHEPNNGMIAPASRTCDPVSTAQLATWVEQAAKRHGVSASVILTVMFQESRLDPCSESPKGAKGLMQLMPATVGHYVVSNPFDSKNNIDAGAHLLKDLTIQFHGDLRLVLAAYNAGPAAVNRAGRDVPQIVETERYVELLRPTTDLATILQ